MTIRASAPTGTIFTQATSAWDVNLALRIPRPSFKYSSTTTIVVPGPSRVLIAGELIVNASNTYVSTSVAGAGGLDKGSIAANTIYYLYAIKSGTSWVGIFSVDSPTYGPTGYSDWSYLGAFTTIAAGALDPFQSCRGDYHGESYYAGVTSSDIAYTEYTFRLPTTAKVVRGLFEGYSTTATDGCYLSPVASPVSSTWFHLIVANNTYLDNYVELPVITVGSVWLKVGNARAVSGWYPTGWIEDPTEYA